MGMDVSGRNPQNKTGEYFRANVWSWRPINEMIQMICYDLLDEETLERLGFNDGAGAKDQDTCNRMADRFEDFLDDNKFEPIGKLEVRNALVPERKKFQFALQENGSQVDSKGRFCDADHPEAQSPYEVTVNHLRDWIDFLRNCGGFEVW